MHDSGLERAHVADVAEELGVPFAAISAATTARLAGLLDPGLEPGNPLDVWGTGARAGEQLSGSLAALADDPAVRAVALAVDLVHEFDGDQSYPEAVAGTARRTTKPVVVLSNVPAAIDPDTADGLRDSGIPVLEGTRTGLLALKHLLDHATDPGAPAPAAAPDLARQDRWTRVITAGEAHGPRLEDLLRDYGIASARTRAADSSAGALAAAAEIGYPVVLKTGEPGIAHKSDAGGVVLGLRDPDALRDAYEDLAERLGRRVLVCETIPAGPELSLGLARDHELGPLLVVGAGGVLVELLADRAVALPPVGPAQAPPDARHAPGLPAAGRAARPARGRPGRGHGGDHRPVAARHRTRRRAGSAGHQPADLRPGRRGGRGCPGYPAPAQRMTVPPAPATASAHPIALSRLSGGSMSHRGCRPASPRRAAALPAAVAGIRPGS